MLFVVTADPIWKRNTLRSTGHSVTGGLIANRNCRIGLEHKLESRIWNVPRSEENFIFGSVVSVITVTGFRNIKETKV